MLGFSAVVAIEVIHPPCPRRVPRSVSCSPMLNNYTATKENIFGLEFLRLRVAEFPERNEDFVALHLISRSSDSTLEET